MQSPVCRYLAFYIHQNREVAGRESPSLSLKKKFFPLLFLLPKFSYTDSSITHLRVDVSQDVILGPFLTLHIPLRWYSYLEFNYHNPRRFKTFKPFPKIKIYLIITWMCPFECFISFNLILSKWISPSPSQICSLFSSFRLSPLTVPLSSQLFKEDTWNLSSLSPCAYSHIN